MGVASSAGGLEAFTRMLRVLPADAGMALVWVLHLDPERPSELAPLLQAVTSFTVREAIDDLAVERSHVYVIPPNAELTLSHGRLKVGARPARLHRPADRFLTSLAAAQGAQAVGIVLSGGDADGREGLRAIRGAGGLTLVQDESAQNPAMPESSLEAGVVDGVLSPEEIVATLMRLLRGLEAGEPPIHSRALLDRGVLDAISKRVVPEWVARGHGELRIWVPGCRTGEEVYALGVELHEALSASGVPASFRIFGTDRSDAHLRRARNAVHAAEVLGWLGTRLRSKSLQGATDRGLVQALRDRCVFARHDLASDPPFAQLDLIRCRDLHAERGAATLGAAFGTLHYALRPGGLLALGEHELLRPPVELFTPQPGAQGQYRRVAGPEAARATRSFSSLLWRAPAQAAAPADDDGAHAELGLAGPGVVVDDQGHVLEFCGRTAPYLEQPGGRPTLHVLALARPEIVVALSEALDASLAEGQRLESSTHAWIDGCSVRIAVRPLEDAQGRQRSFVLFESESDAGSERRAATRRRRPSLPAVTREVDALRRQVRSLIEKHDQARETLEAVSEEIQSSNEELRSLNEELETSKEELQATNEQLTAANEAISLRVDELALLNDDLTNVLASVQIPILMLDRELRIRRFTPAAAPLFNLVDGDVGRPLAHLRANVRIPAFDALLAGVLESGAPCTQDVRDVTGRSHTLRIHPYRTPWGGVDGLLVVLVDVQHMAAARDLAEAIIATVPAPMLVLDAHLAVRSANPAFQRVFGPSRAGVQGRELWSVAEGAWDIPALRSLLRDLAERGQSFEDVEIDHSFPRLGARTLKLCGSPIDRAADGEKLMLLTIEDMTERRRAERKLIEADARKNEFLAMLSHELRNPLAPIVYALELLRSDAASSLGPTAALETIERQIAHMTRLVDDLLEVSRITHGRVELQRRRVDLRAAIEPSVQAARLLAQARRQELRVDLHPEPVWLDADPARIQQIAANLLSNAVKYTPQGGSVQISVERAAGGAVLRVRDSGQGIALDVLPQVFDLFVQGKKTLDRAGGGLGIGLTVVRELVVLHGGTVSAHSREGDGSEFIVRLPLAEDPVSRTDLETTPTPPLERTSAARRRVLVVDDNADSSEMVGMLLTDWGHDVQTATDGPAALELAAGFRPDVVLLDIGLPGMDGYEVARRMRKELPGKLLIVAMTGYGQAEDQRRSRAAGFDLHLVKPMEIDALRAALEHVRR